MKILTLNEYTKVSKTNEIVGFLAKQAVKTVAKAVAKKVIKSKNEDDTEKEKDK